MASNGNRWRGWHLHLSNLSVAASDQVVRAVVGPAIDDLRDAGPPARWFFLRYWQFGPHVRLRVAGLDAEQGERFDARLRERMAAVLPSIGAPLAGADYRRSAAPLAAAGEGGRALEVGELWRPGVYQHVYQPEVDRYGGPQLLARSEELFQVASELALAFLRREPPEAARSGLGLRATAAALGVLADDDRRPWFCRRAAAGWQAWAERGGANRGGADRAGKSPAPRAPGLGEGPGPAPVRHWADRLGSAMTAWRAALGEDKAEAVLHSHIHLLHNRLGLTVGQEHSHYRALADWLDPALAAGMVAR